MPKRLKGRAAASHGSGCRVGQQDPGRELTGPEPKPVGGAAGCAIDSPALRSPPSAASGSPGQLFRPNRTGFSDRHAHGTASDLTGPGQLERGFVWLSRSIPSWPVVTAPISPRPVRPSPVVLSSFLFARRKIKLHRSLHAPGAPRRSSPDFLCPPAFSLYLSAYLRPSPPNPNRAARVARSYLI